MQTTDALILVSTSVAALADDATENKEGHQ